MLKKQYRINRTKDFTKIFKAGNSIKTDNFILRIAKQNRNTDSRFGFVVSNKIDKRSSRRNGLKRRMRAAVQELYPQIESGFDVVIQLKSPFTYPYQYEEIKKQIKEGLLEGKMIKQKNF